jgi:hypothetical protein
MRTAQVHGGRLAVWAHGIDGCEHNQEFLVLVLSSSCWQAGLGWTSPDVGAAQITEDGHTS